MTGDPQIRMAQWSEDEPTHSTEEALLSGMERYVIEIRDLQVDRDNWKHSSDQYRAEVERLHQELNRVQENHVTVAEEIQRRHDAVASLTDDLAKCREAGMTIEHERRRQVKLNQWQADVVEAARKYGEVVRKRHGLHIPWASLDELLEALTTLDKAQQDQVQVQHDPRNESRVEMSTTPRSAEEQRVWDVMQEARQNTARDRKDWGS